jgi:hypothetical protein
MRNVEDPSHALVDAAIGVHLDARAITLAVDPITTVPKTELHKHKS